MRDGWMRWVEAPRSSRTAPLPRRVRCPPAGRKPSVSKSSFEISAGWTFGNLKVVMPCARESRDQLLQTGSTVVDERAERQDLPFLYIKEVGLDSLVGGDGKAGDVVLPGRERLDRALPARLRMSRSQETIRGKIVDRDRDHEPSLPVPARASSSHVQHVVCQDRFLDVSACAEQPAGSGERLGDFGNDSRRAENRELRAERRRADDGHDPAADDRDGRRSCGRASRKAAWRRSGRRSDRRPRRRPCSCCTRPEGHGSTRLNAAGVIGGSSGKYGVQHRFSASTSSPMSSVRQKRYEDIA